MRALRRTLLGLAAVAAISAPAFAAPTAYDGVMLYYPETGRMVMGHVDKDAMDMAMKHAKPVSGPIMIVIQGGKAYMVENMMDKMPDGTRMIDFFDKRTYGNF